MIRTESISATELRQRDLRLEGSFYCSNGGRIRHLLVSSKLRICTLGELCNGDGLYIPHRFKRPYVRDRNQGLQYITGSSIGLADPLHNCLYLSRNPFLIPGRERLMLRPDTILVTSSGETGNVAYVSELFEGAIGSPDLLRAEPDTTKISPGYLYAFLASTIGRDLLTQGTYGGVIPHIESDHVVDLPVPRLNLEIEAAIHQKVKEAVAKRTKANSIMRKARSMIYKSSGLSPYENAPVGRNLKGVRTFSVSSSSLNNRLEARFHDIFVREIQSIIQNNERCGWIYLNQCAEIFLPPRGKWMNVSVGGIPLIGSGEMFSSRPKASRNISAVHSPTAKGLIVHEYDVLVARSGQIYSILGDAVIVGRTLAGKAVSEHAIRILAHPSTIHPGYLYAFLTLPDYGYSQIIRTAYGTSIPSLSVDDMQSIKVPLPSRSEQDAIGDEVLRAIDLLDAANELEDGAQEMLQSALADVIDTTPLWQN